MQQRGVHRGAMAPCLKKATKIIRSVPPSPCVFQTLRESCKGLCEYQSSQSRQSAKLFSSRRNWDSPNPSPAGECAPPPVLGGGAHSLAREGLGESQFRRGDIHTGTLHIYVRTLWWEGKEGVGVTIEEPGEQCTVVFALIVTGTGGCECVGVYCSPDSSMGVTVNLSVSGWEYGGTHHGVST
jgi:hypothetical protein